MARRTTRKWILGLVALSVVAAGGWYVLREQNRKAERLVLLQAARDHTPEAPAQLRAHLDRHPDDAEILEALVEWQLWAKLPFAEVEPDLDRFCQLRPDDLIGLRVRARLRLQNGRPAECVADGLRVLELEPEDHNTRLLVAIAANEAGHPEVAIRELTRLLETSPLPRDDLAAKLIRAHLHAGNAAAAEAVLNKYLSANSSAETLILHGRIDQAKGQYENAITSFRRAADASIEHREAALFYLLESQRALGLEADAEKTRQELDRFKARQRLIDDARQQPDNLAVQVGAARVQLEDGKTTEAIAILEKAMHRLGKNAEGARVLAKAYRRIGRSDRAEEWERIAEQQK